MTTIAQFRTGVAGAIALAGPVSSKAICWDKAGAPIANPYVRLSVTTDVDCTFSPRAVMTTNEDGTLDKSLSALREATVQVRCETTQCGNASDAYALSEGIKIGLDLESVQAALQAVGIVLIETIGNYDLSYLSGDVMTFARAFDARFRYEFSRIDPTPVGVIEHVQVSGEVASPTTITIPVSQVDKPAE